jgi:carbon-monoxide dehydrogenase medium subunit
VIPSSFDYVRADSVEEAVAALVEHGDEAKLLAGGHSLLPLMKLRLANPAVLVDLGRVDTLRGITVEDGVVRIGALTRHHDVQTSAVLAQHAPLLAHAAGHVGDPQVRHRGTLGGSLAHGDPASDLPAVLLAMRGSVVAQGPDGRREIAADDLFTGFLETALAPDEVMVEVQVPSMVGAGWSFQKLTRRAQDWAIVGCAVQGPAPGASAASTGVGLVHLDSKPVRAAATEAALAAGTDRAAAAEQAAEGVSPPDDTAASAEFRAHLARVLVGRALAEAL